MLYERIHHLSDPCLVCKFVKLLADRKSVKCVIYLTKNFGSLSPALASARIAPKICQGQLQTIYSEFPKFHPNPFTSGGVIAGPVNVVETRHKAFPILGEASSPRASPSKNLRSGCVSQVYGKRAGLA